MTGIARPCVANACPYTAGVSGIVGVVADDRPLYGTPGQRFRTIADTMASKRQARQDTANAVGCNHPPGFKSPILRSLQALSRNSRGQGLIHEAAQGGKSGCSCAPDHDETLRLPPPSRSREVRARARPG